MKPSSTNLKTTLNNTFFANNPSALIKMVNIELLGLSFLILSLTACSNGGEGGGATQRVVVNPPVIDEAPVIIIEHEPAVLDLEMQCDASLPVGLNSGMEAAIDLAELRYRALLERTSVSSRQYIDYTDTDGTWELQHPSRWTSGFLPGTLWYLYALTGLEQWRSDADSSTSGLELLSFATDNDTGFQIFGSYGIGRRVLGGVWPNADTVIDDAASTLHTERFNPDVGAYRAWPQSESDPFEFSAQSPFEVNVDMIMNMELVLSAAERSGSSELFNSAVSHADITWENLIRPDFSSYHVAGFNEDGEQIYTRTHQGWVDESTWSRGQSWAIYGYSMLYRYTQLDRMLERAQMTYQFFKRATAAQTSAWIPYADFDAPLDIRNPLDTSASAIVASAAIELYEVTGNTLYLDDALDILNQLVESYLSEDTEFESLLLAGSEQYVRTDDDTTPDPDGYEVGASFGDFYFFEALYRLQNAAIPICN